MFSVYLFIYFKENEYFKYNQSKIINIFILETLILYNFNISFKKALDFQYDKTKPENINDQDLI